MNAISGSTRMAQTRPRSFVKGVTTPGPLSRQQPGWNNRRMDRDACWQSVHYLHPRAAPDTPEAHLHLSPLLPLPRGLFRQVNAHSLSKSRPVGARALCRDRYMTPLAPDLRNTLRVRLPVAQHVPSPFMCMHACRHEEPFPVVHPKG